MLLALRGAGELAQLLAGDEDGSLSDAARELSDLLHRPPVVINQRDALCILESRYLPPATRLAAALLQHWRRPEQQQEDALALAQAAAARSCAYLRCANVGGEGGPAAGEGAGSARCSACRSVW